MNQEYIGSYKILEKKGAGGMAQVYLAVHQDVPNLKVILKVLSDPRLVERFRQEADKLALLDGHPNICRIKHFFSHGDEVVIAMEYIDGTTLEDKIKSMGHLEAPEAVQITDEVLDILSFAHQKDIFHRDIKPGNIMVDRGGQVKVIDFGIAKGKTDPNLTIAGTACGTPAFMAPEQFNPTTEADYALWDIYAVGTTLFMMLTGQCPFKGDNPFALRDAKMFSDPPKPRDLNPNIPKPLEEVILKSMARDTAKRYQTADQMRAALEPFAPPAPSRPRTPPTGVTVEMPAPFAPKSRKLPWMLAAVAAVVVLAFVGYKFWPFGGQGEGERSNQSTQPADSVDSTSAAADVPLMGTIAVAVDPSGEIYLDNELVQAQTDAWMDDVDTGRHVVRVENRRSLQKVYVDTVSLAADSTRRLDYRFTFPPPPEKKVDVVVASIPPMATVFIDDQRQANRTPYTYPMKKGEHRFRVVLETGSGESIVRDSTLNVVGDTTIQFKILTN